MLKTPLDVFAFRSAPGVSQEELQQACRPDTSDLHNIDPDPDEQERISVVVTQNDMDDIKFGTFAALCRIALAKNMRRLTQEGASTDMSGSVPGSDSTVATGVRMSNAAAAAAAMGSLDTVAKYIRARMTEMHDGPWQVIATAATKHGRTCYSAHIDPVLRM